jgi:hypothetical protein
MATAADPKFEMLDRLGPVLCQLGHQRINLSVDQWADGRWYYFVDGKDAQGRFFSGMGETPSKALAAAEDFIADRAAGGIYVRAAA